MPVIKIYDDALKQWIDLPSIQGVPGPIGPAGPTGPQGPAGTEFYYGTTEPSDPDIKVWINPDGMTAIHEIPSGGASGQFLIKDSNNAYDVTWVTLTALSSNEIDAIMG